MNGVVRPGCMTPCYVTRRPLVARAADTMIGEESGRYVAHHRQNTPTDAQHLNVKGCGK